ncbi:tyrosine-protein kinase family protein (plasmid) [Parasedimentitalea marina]|uniref:Tyrosine-protein kinase family protein n=1 Tax=Parasedimentitalea marina TaxID=2483033 RepID=A0A3T0NA63_9RHOB|nr:CpsD/CapB family tyrosine-protein kinase [Parasedimentitalea marina]AZV80918.1 tyrosine-protein kinase family protein [Parasedimentitalea marina]
MKDFVTTGLEDADIAMTQQGFKKFRRRRGKRQDPVIENAPELREFLDTEPPTRIEHVPARLPEPWEILRRVPIDVRQHQLNRSPLVNFFREDPAAKAFDLLRTRLLHTLKAKGWKRVAIAAPTAGSGATFTAVNLALSLARVPHSRTILMDLNHRHPGVAEALKLNQPGDMPGFLAGDLAMEDHLIRPTDTLALGLTRAPDRNAAEILHDSHCAATLEDMIDRTAADVVIYDLPPVLEYDDLTAFLPQVDGVLLVSDSTQTTAAHLAACEKMLAGHTELLGVVLNRARSSKNG